MPKDGKRESFEQLYGKLEASVAKLEQGGLSLDESIALYEEGMTLARACQARLDEAELKITRLKESFAAMPTRNGNEPEAGEAADYEYVAEEDPAAEELPFD